MNKWSNHTMKCPEDGCDGHLVQRMSHKFNRIFYGCTNWTNGCKGSIGAHGDGRPLGIPADSTTKAKRIRAHSIFDKLWKGDNPLMNRTEAYVWISSMMGREVHMGELDSDGCDTVVRIVLENFPNLGE